MAWMRAFEWMESMTDPLKRFNTVLDHAGNTIDPVWLQFAVQEIEKLRALITTAATAEREDDLLDVIETMRELADEWG